MSKGKKITAFIFAGLFTVIAIFLLSWYFGDSYKQFYPISTKEFKIAGLNEGFTPQGLCFNESKNQFLMCGYMKDNSASRVYVVDAEKNETIKYFTLKDAEGKDYVGHSGGIATDGTSVWIVGDKVVNRFMFDQIETVENKGSINIVDSFDAQNGADFVTIENGNLWVGEFHKDGKYDTPDSHHVEVEGKTLKALHLCYKIDESKAFGLDNTTPIKAISAGSLEQGMVFADDKIVVSTSYSLPNSKLLVYENVLNAPATGTIEIDGVSVEHYILKDSNLKKTIKAPSMSEEITISNNKVFILFESACQKYRAFTREQMKNVYSIELEKLN